MLVLIGSTNSYPSPVLFTRIDRPAAPTACTPVPPFDTGRVPEIAETGTSTVPCSDIISFGKFAKFLDRAI